MAYPAGRGLQAMERRRSMIEFLKSATLVVMALTVIGAGVFVAFYG
ncbi:hypothetical protein [Hyphomicrobium sp.]|nr:hypothetical protein [Hyphomicrobium sp.]MCC7252172.1 hypothetical protein [Hyphomicrobium sp.]